MTLKQILEALKKGIPVPDEVIIGELGRYEEAIRRYGGGWMNTYWDLLIKSDPFRLRQLLRCCGEYILEYEKFLNKAKRA